MRKGIVLSLFLFIVGSSFASDVDATKPTPVIIDGSPATWLGWYPLFLSADKRQFFLQEMDKTLKPITLELAQEALYFGTPVGEPRKERVLICAKEISAVLEAHDAARKQLQEVQPSGQRAIVQDEVKK